jgi:hypothetical protein
MSQVTDKLYHTGFELKTLVVIRLGVMEGIMRKIFEKNKKKYGN